MAQTPINNMKFKCKNTGKIIEFAPVMINASLVSAQNRKRYYWANFPIAESYDRGLTLQSIVDRDVERRWLNPKNTVKTIRGLKWDTSGKGYFSQQDRAYSIFGKHPTIPTARTITKLNVVFENGKIGCLEFHEAERLQGFPDHWTAIIIQKEKRGAVIGNAVNVEVVKHIMKNLCNQNV